MLFQTPSALQIRSYAKFFKRISIQLLEPNSCMPKPQFATENANCANKNRITCRSRKQTTFVLYITFQSLIRKGYCKRFIVTYISITIHLNRSASALRRRRMP